MNASNQHPEFEDPLNNYEPIEYDNPIEQALAEDLVSDVTCVPYAELAPNSTVEQAIKRLDTLKVASLVVVDDDGTLQGIFTERDLLERVADRYEQLADTPITSVMTRDPLVVQAGDPAAASLAAIAVAGYRHVPVLDDQNRLLGIVSPRRVFEFLQRTAEQAQSPG